MMAPGPNSTLQPKCARQKRTSGREDFLEEEARDSTKKGDLKQVKRLRGQLANAERMQCSSARIRAALQMKCNGGVTTLNVMEEGKDGIKRIVEIQDPAEVKEAQILERNKHHFKQAHETPLFDSHLVGIINDSTDKANCKDTLDGIPILDIQIKEFPEVKDLMEAMARPNSIQDTVNKSPTRRSPETTSKKVFRNGRNGLPPHHRANIWATTRPGYKMTTCLTC
jgi:hypothetical protein